MFFERRLNFLWILSVLIEVHVSLPGEPSISYKLLRTVPHDRSQFAFLEQLEINATDRQINFWTSPFRLDSAVDIMIPSTRLHEIQRTLLEKGLLSKVIIDDVEKLVLGWIRRNLPFPD